MYRIEQTDCFEWLRQCPALSIHAVCTDPPYGILEFTARELAKLRAGRGGLAFAAESRRQPSRPLASFYGAYRGTKQHLRDYFRDWGKLLMRALVPGAHVCVAGHPVLQHHVQGAMVEAGFEVRPAIMRLYYSFRGGDRPKNAETEFPEVCVSPKGAYEPWMLFRKPIEAKTVAENLRRWKTGGLRRLSLDRPLPDAIPSGRTPKCEEAISNHPCLKPQHFMRIIVRALLPLGEGKVLDPFMGSGSTIAAAEAVGYDSAGLELDMEYYQLAQKTIPRLAALYPRFHGQEIDIELNGTVERESENQTAFVLAEKWPEYRAPRQSRDTKANSP